MAANQHGEQQRRSGRPVPVMYDQQPDDFQTKKVGAQFGAQLSVNFLQNQLLLRMLRWSIFAFEPLHDSFEPHISSQLCSSLRVKFEAVLS
jgi:hypothetical protein